VPNSFHPISADADGRKPREFLGFLASADEGERERSRDPRGMDAGWRTLWAPSGRSGLDPPNGRDAVNGLVERQDGSDTGRLSTGHEVRLGEVEPIDL